MPKLSNKLTTKNQTTWADKNSIQGTAATVIWDVPVSLGGGGEESGPVDEVFLTGTLIISGDITIS